MAPGLLLDVSVNHVQGDETYIIAGRSRGISVTDEVAGRVIDVLWYSGMIQAYAFGH